MFAFYRVLGRHFCCRLTVHSILTQCLTISRTADIFLVSTDVLDDFLMTINIDSKLFSHQASRAEEDTTKPACSFFLRFKYIFAQELLSHLPALVFLFCSTSFVKQMYLACLVLEEQKKKKMQRVITFVQTPERHIFDS